MASGLAVRQHAKLVDSLVGASVVGPGRVRERHVAAVYREPVWICSVPVLPYESRCLIAVASGNVIYGRILGRWLALVASAKQVSCRGMVVMLLLLLVLVGVGEVTVGAVCFVAVAGRQWLLRLGVAGNGR